MICFSTKEGNNVIRIAAFQNKAKGSKCKVE